MDVDVTTVDVQSFSIQQVQFEGAVTFLYLFFITWLLFVIAVVTASVNYYRWHKPKRSDMLSPYIADSG